MIVEHVLCKALLESLRNMWNVHVKSTLEHGCWFCFRGRWQISFAIWDLCWWFCLDIKYELNAFLFASLRSRWTSKIVFASTFIYVYKSERTLSRTLDQNKLNAKAALCPDCSDYLRFGEAAMKVDVRRAEEQRQEPWFCVGHHGCSGPVATH